MEKLTVLYEDNQIIVVIKPQNVPTQSDDSKDVDMLSMVKAYVKEKYNKEGEAFIGLVHRLDRPTGGVMVFARNSKSAKDLQSNFKHTPQKKFIMLWQMVLWNIRKIHLLIILKKWKENMVKVVPMGVSGAKKQNLFTRNLKIMARKVCLKFKF